MDKISPETFFDACVGGNIEIVKQFVSEGQFPIDVRNDRNWTGLIMACFNERIDVAKWLIEHGADINATNQKGTTVFMYAKTPIQQKQTETAFLSYLIEKGADINAKDINGLTVLNHVVKNGYDVLANWLKSMGAK